LPRTVFDISTLSRWSGPPVGIVRTERELARWTKTDLPSAVFAFFDPLEGRYREVKAEWLDAIIDGKVSVFPIEVPSATGRRRRRDRIPRRLQPTVMALPHLRRTLLLRLDEIWRLAESQTTKAVVEKLQQVLMTDKYRRLFFEPNGSRRTAVRYGSIVGDPIDLQSVDILITVGAGWEHHDIEVLRRLKTQTQFRLVTMCYDLMPLLFPQFYQPRDVAAFRKHFHRMFPTADLVVVSSHAVEQDVITYCRDHLLQLNRTEVVSLGVDPGKPSLPREGKLPPGIAPNHFALLVSTIEPRKGHRLMYEVWLRLLAEGVPQRTEFKLVFVGRPGWMVDDLMRRLKSDPRLAGTMHILSFASDDELAALYKATAFCVYPSVYEGYGLPIVEAFARGKAVLASNGGALAETVGDLSPCLDPYDQELWYNTMKRWILEPSARAPYEAAIRARFRPRSWRETTATLLQLIGSLDSTCEYSP